MLEKERFFWILSHLCDKIQKRETQEKEMRLEFSCADVEGGDVNLLDPRRQMDSQFLHHSRFRGRSLEGNLHPVFILHQFLSKGQEAKLKLSSLHQLQGNFFQ